MQHVLIFRKTILVFGFALVVFGCDTNKAQLSSADEVVAALYSYSANGELTSYIEFENDSNGKRTNSTYNASGELINYREWKYDSKGNKTKQSFYEANGELLSYWVYSYKEI